MNMTKSLTIAGLLLASPIGVGGAQAGDELGSYVARISDRDHHASDGYGLSSAAQMVRQDRANWHKFHRRDADDQGDDWFRSNDDRAYLERMLKRGGAMSSSTRNAIVNGEPLIQVDVYSDSVHVSILED
ncbi:hypothetical protein X747_01520 [Mesorhizobium sp. LNJC384A00]|uniref:hypothetical protein n=2 Tax=unclassified Mesorhizobium TaxID=325217 RepID=UPI0003CF6557|nr:MULTISPECIES: hypothetical protein [unclassified Mesorhizobium]ESX13725.1 hypothetical protein X766_28130 [Mesorhizobium sp. LSJC255A00]ESX23989.1 hypothetical protein X765_28395 [Mesorhizobium sp. LSHC440B00]ESX35587.1 hypothetical protein X764_26485 [Mesorhizobium sp. LSHC440A00]ESX36044.1 hypothetical protein X763_14865 [Mesorhizobium sp. LSHC432A00]ESX67018.1 hypothetical protein X757_30910 [Mesorhizobium sp. LSHC414A00]